ETRFRSGSDSLARRPVRAAATQQLASPLSEVLASGVAVGLVWLGAVFVIDAGSLGPEQFLAFVTIALRAISPIKALTQYPATVQQGLAAADRFFEILDHPVEPTGGTQTARAPERELRFEDVTFAYEGEPPVLRDVDLTIECGHVVAVVGASGAGKTTLVDLLPRFADPQRGRVTIDGVDIRAFRVASLRRLIGLVSQETTLLHDTVAANIAYAEPERPHDEIVAAARAAHAHEFIEELPAGYETLLGDRGVRLSGGQRQRIGIARAVLRDPPILILDEATSALDTESESVIQDALHRLFEGRTVIVIGHRLSTVREADRIFVLEAGRLVDSGVHRELIERAGPYRRLFDPQIEPPIHVG
ncbi:MAG: ABC transporter ATP-binding protein/permease, partial [Gemmatimonadetes bacterium]|nr:ABC transporter ATP-binding protein/permease [Gemmatimonadota bacterium]